MLVGNQGFSWFQNIKITSFQDISTQTAVQKAATSYKDQLEFEWLKIDKKYCSIGS
jgi:hypothetical protein